MSKVIKSQKCLDADPCQLQSVDVDAFFVTNEPDNDLPSSFFGGQVLNEDLNASSDPKEILEQAVRRGEETVVKARQEAETILKDAQQERDNLLAKAREDAKKIKDQAQQEGLKIGKDSGLTTVRKEWEASLTTALGLLSEAELERQQRIKDSEGELLKLAVTIGGMIVGEAIKLDPSVQLEIVRRALSKVTTAEKIKIRINPEDLITLQEHLPELQEVFTEPKALSLEEDPAISRGNCFINTEHGNVDARVKSQLDRIMSELLKVGSL